MKGMSAGAVASAAWSDVTAPTYSVHYTHPRAPAIWLTNRPPLQLIRTTRHSRHQNYSPRARRVGA